MARLLIASIVLILIVILGVRDIAIPTTQAYDPPSIYNTGGGGYSTLYTILRSLGYVVSSTDDLGSLGSYSPGSWVLIIASPDRELSSNDASTLINWISSGGRVIALDEVGTLSPLLLTVNASLGDMVRGIDLSTCNVGGRVFDVLYNVYSWIHVPLSSGAEILCSLNNHPVAVSFRVGSGELIFIADSSIAINTILSSRFSGGNLAFFLEILGGRHVLFYEGGREMITLRSSYALSALMLVPVALSYISGQIVSSGPTGILILMILSTLIAIMFVGRFIEIPSMQRSGGVARTKRVDIDIPGVLVKGAESWRRLRGRA